jgi:glycosyltransferase involved in cell wall biosynthesis
MKKILIAIPTKDRMDILPLPLYSLFQQTLKDFDVMVYDQGNQPVTDSYIVRLMFDLLQIHGNISVKHIRSMKDKSLALARVFILKKAREEGYKYLLMLDDDVTLTPDCLEKLLKAIEKPRDLKVIFTYGVAMDSNNSLQHSDYSIEPVAGEHLTSWAVPHHYYSKPYEFNLPIVTGGFHYLIDMSKISETMFKQIIRKLKHLHGMPCEDIMLEYWLTHGEYTGLLITDALVYHFPSTAQPRDWYNVTRKLQERISKTGEL